MEILYLSKFTNLLTPANPMVVRDASVILILSPSPTRRHKLIYWTVSLFTDSSYTATSTQLSSTDT